MAPLGHRPKATTLAALAVGAVLLATTPGTATGAFALQEGGSKRSLSSAKGGGGADTTPPTQPGRLRVLATTTSTVTLSWRKSSDRGGVAGYDVYRDGIRVASVGASATVATVASLRCGTSYVLGVVAYDRAGNRSAQATVVAATAPCADTQPPTAPEGLAQHDATAESATVTWRASSDDFGVVGYEVLRDGDLAGTTASTLYSLTGLRCGAMYTVGIRALDGVGNRSATSTVAVTTSGCPDTSAPTTPADLAVSSADETSVGIRWSPSGDDRGVVGYGVYRDGAAVGSTASPAHTLAGLSCGESYAVAVDAYDAAGNRSARASVTAATAPCPPPPPDDPSDTTPPSAPPDLSVTGATASSISVRWSESTDDTAVAGYGLYRDDAAAGSVAATSATFGNLACGRTYRLAVDAYDAGGNRSTRSTVTSSTAACPDTAPPTPPAGLAQTATTETTVGLAWAPSTDDVGVAGYGIYLAGVRVATAGSPGYTLGALRCGTTYSVGVDAYDAAGGRSAQAQLLVTTSDCPVDTQPPSVPQDQRLGDVGTSSFAMSWSAAHDDVGVTGYALYLNGARVATTTATSYTYTGLVCGTTYTVALAAFDAAGNSSDMRYATGPATTSACPPPAGDTQAPSAPGALAVSGASQSAVTVGWSASSDDVGVAGYGYYRNGGQVGNGTGTSYTFSGLSCGTSYTLAVDAYDAAGNRSSRSSVTASTSACPPPPSGGSTANLWVDTSGGSCVRQATPGAYSDAAACGWSQAYQAAQTGDLILVRGGSYGDVTMGPNRSAISSPGVTFRPASGESVTIADLENGFLTGGASNITFLGPVAARTFRSDGGSNIVVDGWNVDCDGCVGVQIFHLENATNVVVRNSEIADNTDNSLIWIQGTNLTFENNRIHDAGLREGSGAHTECLYAWNVTNLTLKRNHFYHCAVMDVFVTGSSVSRGGHVENNVFEKPWTRTGVISNSAYAFHFRNGGDPSPDPDDWDFLYNTFVGPLSISSENPVGAGGMRVIGNAFLSGVPCNKSNTTYSHNAFAGGGCGTSPLTSTLATLLAGFTSTADPGDYSLRSTSVLRDKGAPTVFPALDLAGRARYTGTAPDVGAFELG